MVEKSRCGGRNCQVQIPAPPCVLKFGLSLLICKMETEIVQVMHVAKSQ